MEESDEDDNILANKTPSLRNSVVSASSNFASGVH